jgi:hypothetical protein
MHPELGLRLAQAKIEEARSRARRESAPRAASPERRVSGVTVGKRKGRWAASMLATLSRSWPRRRRLREDPRGQRRPELPLADPRQLPEGRPLAPRSALPDRPTR